jgi:small subunit ribosomal protein S6
MAKTDTRNYETIFILDSAADEDKIESQIQKYVNFLTKNTSEIVNIDRWGRRKFAYPIKKKHTGYYVSIEFTSGPGIITKLDRTYHLDDNVLRYLTVSYNKKTMAERKTYFEKKQLEQAAREQEAADQSAEQEQADESPVESSSEENKV